MLSTYSLDSSLYSNINKETANFLLGLMDNPKELMTQIIQDFVGNKILDMDIDQEEDLLSGDDMRETSNFIEKLKEKL